jgi:hypothetical protein
MRARRLHSSLIDRVLFDEEAGTLSIWFRASGKYVYHGVPRALYDALGQAASAGRFFNETIRGRYPSVRDPERRRYGPAL